MRFRAKYVFFYFPNTAQRRFSVKKTSLIDLSKRLRIFTIPCITFIYRLKMSKIRTRRMILRADGSILWILKNSFFSVQITYATKFTNVLIRRLMPLSLSEQSLWDHGGNLDGRTNSRSNFRRKLRIRSDLAVFVTKSFVTCAYCSST